MKRISLAGFFLCIEKKKITILKSKENVRKDERRKYIAEATRYRREISQSEIFSFIVEGISQAGVLAFRFDAAREREKLAERVSHHLRERHKSSRGACIPI